MELPIATHPVMVLVGPLSIGFDEVVSVPRVRHHVHHITFSLHVIIVVYGPRLVCVRLPRTHEQVFGWFWQGWQRLRERLACNGQEKVG